MCWQSLYFLWQFVFLKDMKCEALVSLQTSRFPYPRLFNVTRGSDYSSNQHSNLRTAGCECFLVVPRNGQGQVLSELIWKMMERAVWERRAKSTEKCCSKWGVPGPTVPLIKMLTLGGGSSSSPVLLVPSLAADVTFHLSAHEPTPVSPAVVNGVWCARVRVCLVARGHRLIFQSTEWGYFPKAVLF